jgi:NIMA (never in mitosis gene a)-related kinase
MRYTRIRKLGRGAFGLAILYKREEDDALVVVKEFDLSFTAEKTRAEVRLPMLLKATEFHVLAVHHIASVLSSWPLLFDQTSC